MSRFTRTPLALALGMVWAAAGGGAHARPAAVGTAALQAQIEQMAAEMAQMKAQGTAVVATLLWSGIGSTILYKIVDAIVGLRPDPDQEREGLDITDHGERAYNY